MGLCGSHVPDPSSSGHGLGVQAEAFSGPAGHNVGKSDTYRPATVGSTMTKQPVLELQNGKSASTRACQAPSSTASPVHEDGSTKYDIATRESSSQSSHGVDDQDVDVDVQVQLGTGREQRRSSEASRGVSFADDADSQWSSGSGPQRQDPFSPSSGGPGASLHGQQRPPAVREGSMASATTTGTGAAMKRFAGWGALGSAVTGTIGDESFGGPAAVWRHAADRDRQGGLGDTGNEKGSAAPSTAADAGGIHIAGPAVAPEAPGIAPSGPSGPTSDAGSSGSGSAPVGVWEGCTESGARLVAEAVPSGTEAASGSEVHWRLGREVGRGANGAVYEGLNDSTGEKFAVKVLRVDVGGAAASAGGESSLELEAVRREVQALRPLAHANVVRYLGTEFIDGQLLVFMEYCSGGSLLELLASFGGRLPEEVVCRIGSQVLKGLQYLHRHGVTHCDLKPANVMIGSNQVVKIADFGTAISRGSREAQEVQTGSSEPTQGKESQLRGTPYFMSPEVLRGEEPNQGADIWAFGATLFYLLTGRPPWTEFGATSFPQFRAALLDALASNKSLVPAAESSVAMLPALWNVVKSCMIGNSAERPTAAQLLVAIPFKLSVSDAPETRSTVEMRFQLVRGATLTPSVEASTGTSIGITSEGESLAGIVAQANSNNFPKTRGSNPKFKAYKQDGQASALEDVSEGVD